jgi:hypothetical protein
MTFANGSTLEQPWLGFRDYPTNPINPSGFIFSEVLCRVVCSTATDYSKKVGFFKKEHPTKWFAKVVQMDVNLNEDVTLAAPLGGIALNATIQANPSFLEGQMVGPFNSLDEIRAWAGL